VEIVFGRVAKYNNQEEIEDYFRDRNKSDRDLVDYLVFLLKNHT